jgi:hypothetical protein
VACASPEQAADEASSGASHHGPLELATEAVRSDVTGSGEGATIRA